MEEGYYSDNKGNTLSKSINNARKEMSFWILSLMLFQSTFFLLMIDGNTSI